LTDYVTDQALNGVLKWLSKKKYQNKLSARTLTTESFSLYKTKDIILLHRQFENYTKKQQ
jgi:hypothetical protein